MIVRWKNLMILSGLFVAVAMVGVMGMAIVLSPRTAPLKAARDARAAQNYKHAEILYRQALQRDGKNADLLQEVASMYGEWGDRAPAERARHRIFRVKYLTDAAKYAKQRAEPRRLLLIDAMQQEERVESVRLAKDLLALEPDSADAHFVLAEDALAGTPPDVEEATRHLEVLEAEQTRRVRTDWVAARVAQERNDETKLEEIFARARGTPLAPEADPVDGMALLQLRALDAVRTSDPTTLAERAGALKADARRFSDGKDLSAARITQLSLELEKVQKQLTRVAAQANTPDKARATALGDSIEEIAEATFQRALASSRSTDLRIYQAYAEHLMARGNRKRCLEVVNEALKLPIASMPSLLELVMSLREIAIKAALSDSQNASRFELAEPYIKSLIESKVPYYEGLGHLFQGAIDLERSGLANGAPPAVGEGVATPQAKLRDEGLAHLQVAAQRLPKLGAAQALYGVALILSQETALGRQYLQTAQKLGNLEPRYQIWAAWSMVQAGYPEDAEPIAAQLLDGIGQGAVPKDLEGTLHLLKGEIYQARRTPVDLKRALAEYNKAIAGGQIVSPVVQLRLAQVDVLLGQAEKGLEQINALRASGQGSPAAEHLTVLTLNELHRDADARKVLDEARKRYPQSGELVALDAALQVKADRPELADRRLAEFLAQHPDNLSIVQMRAKLLAERLNRADEAQALLNNIADRSRNSAPLVQLALLDLERRDFEAVARTVAKIRGRWKEAAAADLLEAQMAVAQGDPHAAAAHFEAALKKDPSNKVVQLAKAELDRQTGATDEAAKTLEAIARDKPVKEIDPGLSLTTAAESALAAQALEEGDYDGAIHRIEDLLRGNDVGVMARPARWQLVAARAAKGQWPAAKQEIAALLNDPKNPPTLDERVRAANFYRLNKEEATARAQLDDVLKIDPAHPQAVAVRAFMLANAQPPQTKEAAALLRKAIATAQEPPAVFYLMLAALENVTPPGSDGLKRALAVVDEGLHRHPDSLDLVKAKYRVVLLTQNKQAALAVVEQKAQADPKGPFRRLLADVYRDEQEFAKSEQVLRSLLKENPKDRQVAASLVQMVAAQAIQAAERGERGRERALNDEVAQLIRQFRAQFPTDLAFPQVECELAARHGDHARGVAIAEEIDALDHHSPAGPLLLARLYGALGRTSEVAKAYREALRRNPRQPQARLALAQTCLALGDPDEALEQANRVLEAEPDQPSAVLLKARALAVKDAPASEVAANRAQAIQLIDAALKKNPKFSDAYHLRADIKLMQKKRDEAIATLKGGLKTVAGDANGLGMLVQILTEPRDIGKPAAPEAIQEAKALAEQYAGHDEKGQLCLALSIGFQKAGQFELALPWAEKAAAKLDAPGVHLIYGGLLLALAEATTENLEARAVIDRAAAEYDLVLKAQANSVEAVNNKAWILHRYLGNHQEALDLAQGLLRRSDPATLPGEFFDTLGSVQEALGKLKDAESSYAEGLHKTPDQPVLNFHMGRLLAGDPQRIDKARSYLAKAQASADRLPPATVAEVETLLRRIGR